MTVHATSPDLPGAAVATAALAVVAHPDDESFGLGAVLSTLTRGGVAVRVLCLTGGEASTLGSSEDLGEVRARELRHAAAVLGVCDVVLLNHPDGGLADVPLDVLEAEVEAQLVDADLFVVFEPGGVTGHPDHQAATAAATRVAAQSGVTLLEWGVPPDVAAALNDEFATAFVAAQGVDVDVDRTAQLQAIRCHHSQAHDNPVLRRRMELQGTRERVNLVPASRIARVTSGREGRTFASTPGGIAPGSVAS
jgi:LmbE family N-acetylglucosaminyl deacetylase